MFKKYIKVLKERKYFRTKYREAMRELIEVTAERDEKRTNY